MGRPPARVERIVDAALDRSVRACEQATGGRVAETYLLELDGEPGRAVCKIGGPSIRTGDVVEPLVLELVGATTDLPCPAVLASGTVGDGSGESRWALYEFRDGDPPTPFRSLAAPARCRILEETGAMLGELHAAHQFDRTGGLGRAGDRLLIRAPAGLNVPERGRELLAHSPAADGDWQPVLSHGDLFPDNLLVDGDGAVTAFLDWGNAHVTTAGYALARVEMRFVDWFRFDTPEREQLRASLREGYRRRRPLPPDYPRLAAVYKLLWLGQSADRHLRNAASSRGRRQIQRHLASLLP